jgi:hypothetical protein
MIMNDIVAHKITIYALGTYGSIAISHAEFEDIRAAKRRLLLGLGVEEKIDLVLENYAELERCLLDMALDHSIFPGKIHALLDNASHLVNRRIVNLLTTSRLYLDQVLHDFSAIYGEDSESYVCFKQATINEYDCVLGYRVMEALRNHAQHRSLPIQGITFHASRDDAVTPPLIRHSVIPSIDIATLEDDPKFKRPILDELQLVADKKKPVSILPFIRAYVESIGRIHQCVREVTTADVAKAEELIDAYRTKYRDTIADSLTGLAAIACNPQGLYRDHEYLSDRPIKRRRELAAKNQHLDSISRRYVSSRSEDGRQ